MATIIEMPKMSDTMDKGVLLAWRKQEGDRVKPGEVLADVETDKATMELECFDAGYLRKRLVEEGAGIPVGGAIGILTDKPDEDITDLLAGLNAPAAAKKSPKAPKSKPGTPKPAPAPVPAASKAPMATPAPSASPPAPVPELAADPGRRLLISPLAARIAAELNVDLARVRGTGPGGRIVKRDVERAAAGIPTAAPSVPSPATSGPIAAVAPSTPPPTPISAGGFEDVSVSSMRAVIANRLTLSKTTIPHYYVTLELQADALLQARKIINEMRGEVSLKISINDLVIKACAVALKRHPALNSSFQGHTIRKYRSVDIGVAVALEDGLITPVIRKADQKGLETIAHEVRELAERARHKKLKPEEYTGGTFTITNLGMYGIQWFAAVINPPEAAILAVGAVEKKPVVRNEQIVVGHTLTLTLSADHRVVDGAQAAEFMRDLRLILENPAALAL